MASATLPQLSPVSFHLFDSIARAGGSTVLIGIQECPNQPDDPWILFYGARRTCLALRFSAFRIENVFQKVLASADAFLKGVAR